MAEMTIYEGQFVNNIEQNDKDDFDGAELDLTKVKKGFLGLEGRWNDKVNYIRVKSGIWRLYEHHNRGGQHWDYGEGLHFVGDKGISGFEPIG